MMSVGTEMAFAGVHFNHRTGVQNFRATGLPELVCLHVFVKLQFLKGPRVGEKFSCETPHLLRCIFEGSEG